MRTPTRLPLGAILCAMSAVLCAFPTLALPADSPNAPKVAFLAMGATVFAVGVVRVRSEGPARRASRLEDDDANES